MPRTVFFLLFLLTAIIALPVSGDEPDLSKDNRFSRDTLYGFSLFGDFWTYSARYDLANPGGTVEWSGDTQGHLEGITLSTFRASSDSAPLFGEISFRQGELSGDIMTSGAALTTYSSQFVVERQEAEFRAGTVLHSGKVKVMGSLGGLFVGSDTEERIAGSPESSFSTQTYLGTLGLDLAAGKNIGQFTFGARLDSAFLSGTLDGEFVWGYDTRLTAFVDYEIPLQKYDLVFLLKVGGFSRDYFGQESQFPDAAELTGAYIRTGVSFVF